MRETQAKDRKRHISIPNDASFTPADLNIDALSDGGIR
jgi:hypothetical protein